MLIKKGKEESTISVAEWTKIAESSIRRELTKTEKGRAVYYREKLYSLKKDGKLNFIEKFLIKHENISKFLTKIPLLKNYVNNIYNTDEQIEKLGDEALRNAKTTEEQKADEEKRDEVRQYNADKGGYPKAEDKRKEFIDRVQGSSAESPIGAPTSGNANPSKTDVDQNKTTDDEGLEQ